MYKVDIENKTLAKVQKSSFSELNLKERFDIQEWVDSTPEILGEDLLIIAKELVLSSGKRLDLLAVDKEGALVIIELKRDDSGSEVEWQAIKYASYCSSFS
ncbi:MAG: MmcB family DNA repair protein, partial [Deltaproteobacteria bacterium]